MSRPLSVFMGFFAMSQKMWDGNIRNANYSKVEGQETSVNEDETGTPISSLRTQNHQILRFIIALAAWLSTASLAAFVILHLSSPNRIPVPEFFPPEIVTERPSTFSKTAFADPPSPDSDDIWETIIPSQGRGFVAVYQPQLYGISRPGTVFKPNFDNASTGPSPEVFYSVSVFHQLHCLRVIRRSYYTAIDDSELTNTDGGSIGDADDRVHHVGHCFDFLRQALQCNGDTTLEFANEEVDINGQHSNVDGWGVVHRHCKDWDALWRWTVEHSESEKKS